MSKSINRYIELQGGFAFKSSDFIESGIPLIRISNITKDGLNKTDAKLLPIEYQSELKEYLVLENDTLIAMSGATTGKSCIVKKCDLPCLINQRVGRFKIINEQEIDKTFVFYVVNSSEFQNELLKDAVGGAQPNVSPKQIEKISWDFPLYNKQRKIAQILSSADTVIEKTQTAIAKYKAIKQGMLNDLFTSGIDIKTGKLRPKYEDAPELYKESKLGWIPKEWDENPLEELVNIDAEQLSTSTAPDYSFYYIDISAVTTGNIIYPQYQILYKWAPSRARRIIKYNDVLMSTVRPNLKAFAHFKNNKNYQFVASTGFAVLNAKPNADIEFVYQVLFTEYIDKQIEMLVVGSNYPAINSSDVKNLIVNCPPKTEQTIIAERMLVIDNKLQSEQTYLQKLQMLKSGLMNDLLSGKRLVSVPNELETETSK